MISIDQAGASSAVLGAFLMVVCRQSAPPHRIFAPAPRGQIVPSLEFFQSWCAVKVLPRRKFCPRFFDLSKIKYTIKSPTQIGGKYISPVHCRSVDFLWFHRSQTHAVLVQEGMHPSYFLYYVWIVQALPKCFAWAFFKVSDLTVINFRFVLDNSISNCLRHG